MKQRKLKKWVVYTLRFIFIISLLVGISDCGNFKFFVISHIIALVILLFSGIVLIKDMNK